MRSRWRRRLREFAPAVVVFVGVLALLELVGAARIFQSFILPRPSAVVAAFGEELPRLQRSAVNTLYEAIGGLVIGVSAGTITAFAIARWARVREAVLPIAVGASAIPIIAAAPIMSNWFGILNPFAKMAIVILLTFFPMVVNVARGLSQVDESAVELMRASAASDGQVLRKLRIPNAMPYWFTALRIATTLSVIGAVVGEFFGGPLYSLGIYITYYTGQFKYPTAWAAIVLSCALGIGCYLAAVVAERIVLPWNQARLAGES